MIIIKHNLNSIIIIMSFNLKVEVPKFNLVRKLGVYNYKSKLETSSFHYTHQLDLVML